MEIVKLRDWRRPQQPALADVRERVVGIIDAVEREGDPAIDRISREIDGFKPELVSLMPWTDYPLTSETRRHLPIAAERIRAFATMQRGMYRDLERNDDHGRYGQKIIALDSMAAYIPGGRFPLVSTALMTLIPAAVAGVADRIAISPSDHPALLAAASLAGATRFLRLGGAQAIAAAALGSRLQAPVDMVVGPGNAYVNTAKALLQDRIKIDTLAGPSEILVLCDETAQTDWIALDLLAQAEHDPLALSVVGCSSRTVLARLGQAVQAEQARRPDKDRGLIQLVHCPEREDMIELANRMAPEHLHLAMPPNSFDHGALRHYGSLFIGPYSAVALGDYCTGPNHTLPTLGFSRQKGGLHVGDFLKILTYQEIRSDGYAALAESAIALAKTESLDYHRESLSIRLSPSRP